jgi:single-strand DNA-binding protein
MDNINSCIFNGRLTKDPVFSVAGSGTKICNISIANNVYYNKSEKVNFLNCVAFGNQAERIAKYFKKGSAILLECQARQETWEDKDGKKRQKVVFIIQKFYFIEKKKQDDNTQSNPVEDLPF